MNNSTLLMVGGMLVSLMGVSVAMLGEPSTKVVLIGLFLVGWGLYDNACGPDEDRGEPVFLYLLAILLYVFSLYFNILPILLVYSATVTTVFIAVAAIKRGR